MSADEYTPTEDEVRMAYGDARCVDPDDPAHSRGCPQDEEFYRFLVAHVAEVARAAKAEAWDEGRESLAADMAKPVGENGMRPTTLNPYRKEATDE